MSDEVVGTCCASVLTACLDVIAGICVDFASSQHACTQTLCRCSCLGCHKDTPIDDEEGEGEEEERDPLLPHSRQPPSQPPMRSGTNSL